MGVSDARHSGVPDGDWCSLFAHQGWAAVDSMHNHESAIRAAAEDIYGLGRVVEGHEREGQINSNSMSLQTLQRTVAAMILAGGFIGIHSKLKEETAALKEEIRHLNIRTMTLEQRGRETMEIARMHDVSLAEIVNDHTKNKVQIH
jgi:hypothetical protein